MHQVHTERAVASEPFDAIIIGSGLGGLIAGALLAQAGKRVLLLERHDKFGGAATTFKRRDLQVEVSLCVMDGLDAMDFKTPVFAKLGLSSSVPIVTAPDFYHLHHPLLGDDFVMPRGFEQAMAACTERFPQHAKGIRTYFTTIRQIRNTRNDQLIQQLKTGHTLLNDLDTLGKNLPDDARIPLSMPDTLWRARKISMARFLQTLFGNDESIKFVLCANMYFTSSDLNHISIFDFSLSQASYHYGSHYVHGGSQRLSDQLVHLIRNAGGQAWCRRNVTRILIEQGRAVGVEHHKAPVIGSSKPVNDPDPQQARARLILGNAPPRAIGNLLPEPHKQIFDQPYNGIPADNSNWTIYLGFDKKPSHYGVRHYVNFVYPAWFDTTGKLHDSGNVMGLPPGSKVPPFLFCDYSQLGEMIAESGQCLGMMGWLDRLSNWQPSDENTYQTRKSAWLDQMIAALDKRFPGIGESIVYKEMATPRTVQAYLNDPEGGVHGFADPELMKLGRPLHRSSNTTVDGLLIASAFMFGTGYSKAILAGTVAAEAAFRELQKG
ncbi:MAG: NAD(P)/FAD-dependent oxidoreductase [Magnetococcales bacterium]|nr:NAD(P)/FAD-dependent oxidoreductase [Magnetococcales bacterium]